MSVSFRAIATLDSDAHASTDIDISKPTGTTASDVLLAIIRISNADSSTVSESFTAAPEGWTELYNANAGGRQRVGVWWKRAKTSDGATFTWTRNSATARAIGGFIVALEGANSADPFDATNVETVIDGTSTITPGVTAAEISAVGGYVIALAAATRVGSGITATVTTIAGGVSEAGTLGLEGQNSNFQVVAIGKVAGPLTAAHLGVAHPARANIGGMAVGDGLFGMALYMLPGTAPTLTAITPDHGSIAGGEAVTLTGSGFDASTEIEFNSVAATNITLISPTQIRCTTPAGSAGDVDVDVIGPGGVSTITYHYTDVKDDTVRLVVSGSVAGDDKSAATQFRGARTVQTYGGANDLWGNVLTPALVNASTFGLVYSVIATDGVAKVYSVALAVAYSLPTNSDRGAMLSVLHVDADRSTARPRAYSLPRAGLTLANDPNLALAVDDAEFRTSRFFRPSRNVAKTFTAVEFTLKMTPETNTPGFQVWASIDDGMAVQLLESEDGPAATLYTSGHHRLYFPTESAGKYVQFRPTIPAKAAGQQDVRAELRDFRVMGAVNPRARNRINASLAIGRGEFKDLTSMRQTVAAQQDALAALKGRTVSYQTPWGDAGWVTVERVAYREVANKNGTWSAVADFDLREALYE